MLDANCHPPGVNDIIKEHAQLIAGAGGFRVLIPDLYKGKVGLDAEEASHVSVAAVKIVQF
jgi:dienelactone hydrolase